MYKLKLSHKVNTTGLLLIVITMGILFVPGVLGAANDACFNGGCHTSPNPRPIDRSLYSSSPHNIIECVDCKLHQRC